MGYTAKAWGRYCAHVFLLRALLGQSDVAGDGVALVKLENVLALHGARGRRHGALVLLVGAASGEGACGGVEGLGWRNRRVTEKRLCLGVAEQTRLRHFASNVGVVFSVGGA